MTDYVRQFNFTAKDALPPGDPNKKIKGSEIDQEYNAAATAINSKFDSSDLDVADGIPQLDASGKYKSTLLPDEWTAVLILANTVALQGKEIGGTARDLVKVNASDVAVFGTSAIPASIHSSSIPSWFNGTTTTDLVDEGRLVNTSGGLQGGGALSANLTLSLTDTGVGAGSYGSSNTVGTFTVDAKGRLTAASAVAINHNTLSNYVSNQHIDHSTVVLSAGTGISGTGLGNITASRSIALDTSNARNADHSAINVSAGNGVTGGGNINASRTITLGTGGSVTPSSTNAVTASSHTHALDDNVYRGTLGSAEISAQSGGSPSGGSNGDIILIY